MLHSRYTSESFYSHDATLTILAMQTSETDLGDERQCRSIGEKTCWRAWAFGDVLI